VCHTVERTQDDDVLKLVAEGCVRDKRDGVKDDGGKLYNEGLDDLYCATCTRSVMKSVRMT
jgi:hypothetical protein